MIYDLVVIGGGPAGLTAAIYSLRNKLTTLIISKNEGLLGIIHRIENYPGFKEISGPELLEKLKDQVKSLGGIIKTEEVINIKKENSVFRINTKENQYFGKTIILATGTEKAKSNIVNEDKFIGRGISYCTTCDARFFKDKTVGVIGGGNSAVTSALLLSKYAKTVYIFYRGGELKAEKLLVDKLDGIKVLTNTIVKKVDGDNVLREVIIEHNGEEKIINIDGLFVEIGYVPSTILSKQLNLELDRNYIKVNDKMETNISGVFAAGDVTTGSGGLRQIITACSEGAIASISAYKYLKNQSE